MTLFGRPAATMRRRMAYVPQPYTPEIVSATYGGPVIMLAPGGSVVTVAESPPAGHPPHRPHRPAEPPHHRPVHEPLGREPD